MSKKDDVVVAHAIEEKLIPPKVYAATAVAWDGAEAQIAQGGDNAPPSVVASSVGSSGGVVIAQPEQLCYEVLSVRLLNPVAETGRANLIESGVDINEAHRKANHRNAKEQLQDEQFAIAWGNKVATPDYTREELRVTQANSKSAAQKELDRIRSGNRTTIASAVEGEKSVIHVQVPQNAIDGMLLQVEVPASKKGSDMQHISFPLPRGAQPGAIIEVVAGVQDADEAAILAKMERLRAEAEEKIKRETEQEEYSYKGLGDGEYEYKASTSSSAEPEAEYTYGG